MHLVIPKSRIGAHVFVTIIYFMLHKSSIN